MAQFAYPTGSNADDWKDELDGTTNIHLSVDEVSANDADYIHGGRSRTCRITLGSVNDPNIHTGHILRFRAKTDSDGADVGVALYEGDPDLGGTLIASTIPALTTSFAAYEYTLTTGESAAITNYGNLRYKLEGSPGGTLTETYVSQIYMEFPDVVVPSGSVPRFISKTPVFRGSFY